MAQPEGEGLRFDERMSDVEALLWALEAHDPRLRSTITVAVMFDRSPDAVAVAERVDRLTRCLPRFRDRVVAGPLATAPPRWEPDPDFDLDRHLIRVTVQESVTLDDLLRAAEPLATGPFAPNHPPWQMRLLEDATGGGALIIKLHHTFTDGLGAVKLAAQLFDFERHPQPAAAAPRPGDWSRPSTFARMWDDLVFEADRSLDVARRVLPWVADGIRDAIVDPVPRARSTLELVRSLRRLAATAARPPSPILGAGSPGARLAALAFPLADLRQAARRAGGTVNDVFLAGVVGGLRLYHAKRGQSPPSVRLGVPVSTRGAATDADLRNQVAPIVVSAPLQLLDPVERIRLLHDLVLSARHQPALELFEYAAGMLRRIPGAVRGLAGLAGASDVMVSNVPGSPLDLYLGGARVQRLIPLGPRGGAGLNLTLLSHVESVHIGVNMDPVSIPDPDVCVHCLRAGFDETLA
jgi:diacylglycerol O-acyltransferase